MNLKKTAAAIAVFVLAPMGFAARAAQAADCGITAADVDRIAAIQNDPTLSYSEEIRKELAARKELVTRTIACAKNDIASLKAEVAATPDVAGADALKTQLGEKLGDAAAYYDIELEKLAGAGIGGSQAIAREMLAWRTGTYSPLAETANNFILWAKNQEFFMTAERRMGQTERTVAFIQGISENIDLQNALNDAKTALGIAERENDAAKSALAQFLPPDETLALVKTSLDGLANTYQKFGVVNDRMKTLLAQ